jgi:hypothetical protein
MGKISKSSMSILYIFFGLVIGIIGYILGFIWFGWKMLLVIFLLQWSNNISNGSSKLLER